MQSTISRAGTNVLSPVKSADRSYNEEQPFSSPLRERKQESKVHYTNPEVEWVDGDDNDSSKCKLPFPLADELSTHHCVSGAISFDSTLQSKSTLNEPPRTMIFSRSQDLHASGATGAHPICCSDVISYLIL